MTFGIASFLQYEAQLHESNGYNAFDVTRGYLNIEARLNDRVIGPFLSDEVSSAAPARTVLAIRHRARIIGVEPPSWPV